MASFGRVLDLLDNRHINIEDVAGTAEALPTLVPYEEYTENVLVYQMNTDLSAFMGLLQDFTVRSTQERRKELWSWYVQWEVEACVLPMPSPKKPRMGLQRLDVVSNAPRSQRNATAPNAMEQRILDPQLLKREELLRILMAVVQVESSIVPNFIEFLYRWIDYYQGDGKALKAALRREIPSLWDFEYHPLTIPEDAEKMGEGYGDINHFRAQCVAQENAFVEGSDRMVLDGIAQELLRRSSAEDMREKPDLAALLRKKEESERLRYREVKYGIQRPSLNEPLPPLINVPRDKCKRIKYYTACFKSRQRAIGLLFEAGITFAQINQYRLEQLEHPKDTPFSGRGRGLIWYHKEASFAQGRYEEIETEMALKEKSMEVTISNKLAAEAQRACDTKPEGRSAIPLIPVITDKNILDNDVKVTIDSMYSASTDREERINVVPSQLVSKMKSTLFEGAIDKEAMSTLGGRSLLPSGIPLFRHSETTQSQSMTGIPNVPSPLLPLLPSLPTSPLPGQVPAIGTNQYPGPAPISIVRPAQLTPAVHQPHFSHSSFPESMSAYFGGRARQVNSQTIPFIPAFAEHNPGPLQNGEWQSWNTSTLAGAAVALSSTTTTAAAATLGPTLSQSLHMQLSQSLLHPNHAIPSTLPNHSPPPWAVGSSSLPNQLVNSQWTASQLPFSRPGISRNAPSPLNLAPPPSSPLSSLASNLSAVSPLALSSQRVPIQIYFPRIVAPSNVMMGDSNEPESDAMLLGSCCPGSGTIVLHRAVFLPVGVWKNTLYRASKGGYTILETYPSPHHSHLDMLHDPTGRLQPSPLFRHTSLPDQLNTAHGAAYLKLAQAHAVMACSQDREMDLAKRWRASPGPMASRDRGAVWEGWAVVLDREIAMGVPERKGAFSWSGLIDHGVEKVGYGLDVGASTDELQDAERYKQLIDDILAEEGLA